MTDTCELTRVRGVAHAKSPETRGRVFLNRVLRSDALGKLHRELRKHDHASGGYKHPTFGRAAAFQDGLRDRRSRFRRQAKIPRDCSLGDEELARSFAVAWTFVQLAEWLDAELDSWLVPFNAEVRKAQRLHDFNNEYDEAARGYIRNAANILHTARSRDVTRIVCGLGWSLERDFGIRAPRLVAQLVAHALFLKPKQLKERSILDRDDRNYR
jgi:hypothetical protein